MIWCMAAFWGNRKGVRHLEKYRAKVKPGDVCTIHQCDKWHAQQGGGKVRVQLYAVIAMRLRDQIEIWSIADPVHRIV